MEDSHQTLSRSRTGQLQAKPTKEERDAAYSTGAGRKAVDVELPTDEEAVAPIGLDLETRAQQESGRH